jgi:CubicO group peptidase (beta-lactamase class C family)
MSKKHQYNFFALILVCFSANADFDERFYSERLMGIDLKIRLGEGPTPIKAFGPINSAPLIYGKPINLNEYLNYPENMSAVALFGGKIVFEKYNHDRGFDESFLVHGLSMTKTITGIVIGQLLCKGKIKSLDDELGKYSQSLAKSIYSKITIKNALRMASGINENRDDEKKYSIKFQNRKNNESNDSAFILQSVKMKFSEQGLVSRYHSLDVEAVSVLISELTGKSAAKIFHDEIISRFGAEGEMIWQSDKYGRSLGTSGLYMTTRDWARVGQFINNEIISGTCVGQYLLDGVQKSLESTMRDYQRYGYLFWVSNISEKPMIVLTGNYGQALIANYHNNSVIVIFSASNFNYGNTKIIQDVLPNLIKHMESN